MATPVFDWIDYLQLAKQLAADPDEASQRSSISRAYYCVYHKASERAVSAGFVGKHSHRAIWNVYDRECRKLSQLGYRMKKAREDADYESAVPRIAERVNVQLRNARNFLNLLAALGPLLPKP